MKITWMVKVSVHGFKMTFMVYGTEQELWAYLRPDFGGDERTTGNYSYRGATEKEIKAYKAIGGLIYLASDL